MSYQDHQSPWGQKKRPQGPEELIAMLLQKLRDAFGGAPPGRGEAEPGPGGSPANFLAGAGKMALIVVAIMVLQLVYGAVYTIQPGEAGLILRFGKYHRTSAPGLHFKVPMMETLNKVDVETVRKEEFGFRTKQPGQQSVFERRGYDNESLMLTGDKNVINVAWIVQYKVRNPIDFLFNVRNVPQAVRDFSEMVTRRIVGNMDFDYVLSNREIVAAQVKKELQESLDRLRCGVQVGAVQLQDINPPDPVKPAFNEVNEADQDMKRLVNEAEEQYNRVIPKARGDAKRAIEESHGYAMERINRAQGEVARFLAISKEYLNAQDVTRRRLYLETMQEILPRFRQVWVMDEGQKGPLPLLNLDRALQQQTPTKP